MRLTLRTLLAYLDHTLEPADEAALGEKVRQSSFASGLVDRIDSVLSSPQLTTAPPDAAGPTDDANAIAEYLDNTLAPEATAEVERQCIESDVQLAEVAANHQVLTIALGEPAHVPQTLRQRLYDLKAEPSATGAGAAGPNASAATAAPIAPVTPVGPGDSGVAAATTRLPQELDGEADSTGQAVREDTSPRRSTAASAMAGERSREALEALGAMRSAGRPSRVTPWLVSLALAAAFLFVLTQAFQPYLRRPRPDATGTPPIAEGERPRGESEASPGTSAGESGEEAAAAVGGERRATTRPERAMPVDEGPVDDGTVDGGTVDGGTVDGGTVGEAADEPSAGESAAGEDAAEGSLAESAEDAGADDAAGNARRPFQSEDVTEVDAAEMLDAAEARGEDRREGEEEDSRGTSSPAAALGYIDNDGGLLLTQDPRSGVWDRLFSDSEIESGVVLVCGPTFRSRVMLDSGVELTLIGPAGLRIDHAGGSRLPRLTIDFGRILLMATEDEPVEVSIATPAASGSVWMAEAGTTAAVSVDFRRPPGTDPAAPGSSQPLLGVLSVQNRVEWQPPRQDARVTLRTGEQMQIAAGKKPAVSVLPSIPPWLDPPAESVSSLEATARTGLVEFMAPNVPVELALREAVTFRREEVGALAARTLLTIGMPDSYFGPQGVLNRRGQRTYWPELVESLRQFINRGPQAAAIVAQAAQQLEGQAAKDVLRLLQGYSDAQLQRGGDAALVAMLDSPSMAVRVLAAETLRQITGTTLYFRADYDTPARRSPGIKKWEARLARGQIRWSDDATATATSAAPGNAAPDNAENTDGESDAENPASEAAEDLEGQE